MKKTSLFIIVLVTIILMPSYSFAASVFFGTNNQQLTVGQKFEVGVFLNTNGEDVSAIEGKVIFPSDTFAFGGFYTGSSIVTLWVEQPNNTKGTVSFSGVVPGGVNVAKGYLFSIILTATAPGRTTISSVQEKVFLNDGKGSEASITKAPLSIEVVTPEPEKPSSPIDKDDEAKDSKAGNVETFTPIDDSTPPEPFELTISRSEHIFDGQWFLVFEAQDKGSGIDHYEILEKKSLKSLTGFFTPEHWTPAQSPYLLQDQNLQSTITIKAVDIAGNERIATMKAPHQFPWYKNYIIWLIAVAVIVVSTLSIILVTKKNLWKRKRK
jgi:hypothetical protein